MTEITTILFDFDRTLRFPVLSWEDFTFEFFSSMGISLGNAQKSEIKRWVYYYFQSPEFLAARDQAGDEVFWQQFYAQYTRLIINDEEQVSRIAPILHDQVVNDCFLNYRDHVPESSYSILEQLIQSGYKLGIITNRTQPIDEELRQLRLAEYFPTVVVSGLVGSMKPEAAIFHYALEQIQARPEQAVYIGDNYYADVVGARSAGLYPILVDPDQLFPEAECPVIDSIADLPDILQALTLENEPGRAPSR